MQWVFNIKIALLFIFKGQKRRIVRGLQILELAGRVNTLEHILEQPQRNLKRILFTKEIPELYNNLKISSLKNAFTFRSAVPTSTTTRVKNLQFQDDTPGKYGPQIKETKIVRNIKLHRFEAFHSEKVYFLLFIQKMIALILKN